MDPRNSVDQDEPEGMETWQYAPTGSDAYADGPGRELEWTAPEYASHDKEMGWYALFGFGAIAVITAVYALTRDVITAVSLLVIAAIFAVGAGRKPRMVAYAIDQGGVHVGAKYYAYSAFKSFSLAQDGPMNTVLLLPMKRFMPLVSMGYPPTLQHDIEDTLGSYLPYEQHQPDPVERLMHRVRF